MKRIICFLSLILISCSSETDISELPLVYNQDLNNTIVIDSLPEQSYLALGDSYTIGESVNEQERWPVQLVKELSQQNYQVSDPVIIAKTGWTTTNLINAIQTENLADKFDIVTLSIGVNNQFQGGSILEFQKQFSELLNKAISLTKNKPENVIVVSIPDWGVSPFANFLERETISREIDTFNIVKKEETLKMNARFVDITSLSRLALNNSEYIASDNLHFSGDMYKLWVEEIIKQCFNN